MHLRHVRSSDYERALSLTDAWWDGRPRGARLSRVFFVQYAQVSFAFEADGDIVGLVLGHLSQTRPDEATVHFAGVHPAYRRLGLGRRLYERFFAAAQMNGRRAVRALTVPTDREAIAFHLALGFEALPGDAMVDGVPVCLDYAGKGGHRVVFRRPVGPEVVAAMPVLSHAG
jgi:ribosomal protein S18 acetylase RimI-like enzyme